MERNRDVNYMNDLVFYLGVFFIPFDNLFFAPSAGWATIAPIILFCYVLLNLKYVTVNFKVIIIAFLVAILSLINYISFSPTAEGLFDCVSTLCLGIAFYLAINIFFLKKNNSAKLFLQILFIAYTIAFCYGLISLLNLPAFESFRMLFEKRNYEGRLQYTFTEPSFISMHLYGVMLPCIFIFKKYVHEVKKLKILLLCYVVITCVFGASARFYLDTLVVAAILFVQWIVHVKSVKNALIGMSVAVIVSMAGIVFVFSQERLRTILDLGVYADASLASRFFRINAIIKGLFQDSMHAIFGFGIGNTSYPFNMGYDSALAEYQNSYMAEILDLKDTTATSFFCGHLRVIAEMGLIFYILFMAVLWKKSKGNRILFVLVVYLYVQFDSYAFYTVWLLLFYSSYSRTGAYAKKKMLSSNGSCIQTVSAKI